MIHSLNGSAAWPCAHSAIPFYSNLSAIVSLSQALKTPVLEKRSLQYDIVCFPLQGQRSMGHPQCPIALR